MRLAICVAALTACTSTATAPPPAPPPSAPAPVAAGPLPAATAPSPAPKETASATPPAPPPPKVVLQLGDSMVGGYNSLAKALAPKFEAIGAKFVRDWQDSVGIATYDHEHRIEDLIKKSSPDLVLVTLGANDVTVPSPWALAKNVQSIARKVSASGRVCYWLTPPLWRKDTGIVEVIKQNAAPCKVFDASHLKVKRRGDGIHPNDAGGETWAEAFFAFYNGTGPATADESVATR